MTQLTRRWISILLALALVVLFAVPALAVTPEDYDKNIPQVLEEGHLNAASAILMDGVSGRVLFTKNARARMYPASTTKIMTLLLAVESGIPLETPIIIPQQASKIPSDSTLIPVFPKDQMTFGDLLYGFMLASGNDGANAVAVLVGGSLDAFVERMNARATQLGCTDTHFVNAHGYHDPDHYTTAHDLALITQAALNLDICRQIVSCPRYTMTIRRDGEVITPTRANTNLLLSTDSGYYYKDCIGVKTGTHSMAGQCFVGAAERDGVRLISVALKCAQSNQKWVDTIRMFNFGFTRYQEYSLDQMFVAATDQIGTVKISNAIKSDPEGGTLQLKIARVSDPDYKRMVAVDVETALDDAVKDFVTRSMLTITHSMVAPVTEGEKIGEFRYVDQSGEEITAWLVAGRSIEEQPPRASLTDFFPFIEKLDDPLILALIAVLVALFILLIIAGIVSRANQQRYRAKIYKSHRRDMLRQERERARKRREARRKRREEMGEEDDFDDDFDDDDDYDTYDDDYDDYDDD